MISKTVDFTNLNFGRPLGLSMKGKKKTTGKVDDLISLVRFFMATNLCEGVFNQILLKKKRLKMTILRQFSNFAPLSPPHFEDNWIFLTFHQFLIYQAWITKIWLVLVYSEQSYA